MIRKRKIIKYILVLILITFVISGLYLLGRRKIVKEIGNENINSSNYEGEVVGIEEGLIYKEVEVQGVLQDGFSDIIQYLYEKFNSLKEETEDNSSSSTGEVVENENVNVGIEDSGEEIETPQDPPACPISTLGCVKCEIGEQYCRYEEGEVNGYLGWACQNNNPSNIRYSGYRSDYIVQMGGTAPCGEKGGFMVFATYEIGYNSVKAYIRAIDAGLHPAYSVYNCGDCTLLEFFSKYAPNNPEGYSSRVAEIMGGGVDINITRLSWIVDNRLDDFVQAIQHIEGYWTKDGRL